MSRARPRTLATAVTDNALAAYLEMDRKGVVDLAYFISESESSDLRHLCIRRFLTFEYTSAEMELVARYVDGMTFDPAVYEAFRGQLYRIVTNIARHDKDFQSVPWPDYLQSANLLYRFLYALLKKERIELVVFGYVPHVGYDDILYLLCRAMGIRTIILQLGCTQTSSSPFMQYAFSYEDAISFRNVDTRFREAHEKVNGTFDFVHPCTSRFREYEREFKFLEDLSWGRMLWRLARTVFHRGRFAFEMKRWLLEHDWELRAHALYLQYKFWCGQAQKPYDGKGDFVYFPLHYQPELTTSVWGGKYADQALAIERLSAVLPPGWRILVKENPLQTEYMRGPLFFKRLSLLGNVTLIDAMVPSATMLRDCRFVATITGTAAFEAISGGKPALLFGDVWWDFLPGIFKWRDGFDLDRILSCKIDRKAVEAGLNDYLSRTPYATIDSEEAFREFHPEFSHEENLATLESFISGLVVRAMS